MTKHNLASRRIASVVPVVLLGCGFALGFFQLESNDVFWHMTAGEWVVDHGRIPSTDPFSYTAEGSRWIFHNWLFDVPLHFVGDYLGLFGLIIFRALCVAALGLLLFALTRPFCPPALAGVLAVLALAAMRVRFFVRPVLGSFFLFAGILALLIHRERSDDLDPRRLSFWSIPLLVLVWANTHASVVFGLILVGTFWLARVIRRRPQSGFLQLGVASLCASLINPNEYRILTYPFEIALMHSALSLPNQEFATPSPANLGLAFYWVLIAAGGVILLVERTRVPVYLWILIAGFGYLGLSSYRGIPTLSIVLVFAMATLVRGEWPLLRRVPLALALMLGITGGAIALYPREMKIQLMPDRQPVSAADFAEEVGLRGRFYNSSPFGGYLIHRWYPERQVFMDGRDLLHRDTILRVREEGYATVLASYDVQWILAGYPDAMLRFMPRDEWALIYFDDFCAILARAGGVNQSIIDRFEFRAISPFDLEARITGANRQELSKIADELDRAVRSSHQARRLASIRDEVRRQLAAP